MMLFLYGCSWFFGLGNILASVAGSATLTVQTLKNKKEDEDRYICRH